MTIDARYLWQTNDGEIIIVRNAGPFGSLVPTFEARADGKYSWLNSGTYLSSKSRNGGGRRWHYDLGNRTGTPLILTASASDVCEGGLPAQSGPVRIPGIRAQRRTDATSLGDLPQMPSTAMPTDVRLDVQLGRLRLANPVVVASARSAMAGR